MIGCMRYDEDPWLNSDHPEREIPNEEEPITEGQWRAILESEGSERLAVR